MTPFLDQLDIIFEREKISLEVADQIRTLCHKYFLSKDTEKEAESSQQTSESTTTSHTLLLDEIAEVENQGTSDDADDWFFDRIDEVVEKEERRQSHWSEQSQSEPTEIVGTDGFGKYTDQGQLGAGGMGEVRRVQDEKLKRNVAMKIAHSSLLRNQAILSRFLEEAQVCAQLEHPNIVPVHEMGTLEDGRYYFTMKEIKGREFSELVAEVHQEISAEEWNVTVSGWSIRRLIDAFYSICEALAFAHSRGVVHRDLKPENIMIGEYGEVLVVDWGLAKICSDAVEGEESFVQSDRQHNASHHTRIGQVAGTPAWMAPEQAEGRVDLIDARTDVYALGAILYFILSGHAPYHGDSGDDILQQVRSRPPLPVSYVKDLYGDEKVKRDVLQFQRLEGLAALGKRGPELPQDLVQACERAMQREPADRYQSADELAQAVRDWLDGAKRREKALKVIDRAMEKAEQSYHLQQQAQQIQNELQQLRQQTPPWGSVAEKSHIWELEERHESLLAQSYEYESEQEYLLRAAFTHMPQLLEAHYKLSRLYKSWHQEAENNNDEKLMKQSHLTLQRHVHALPEGDPEKIQHLAYLKGVGAVTIVTSPSGAEVILEKYVVRQRRMIPEVVKVLGRTPLIEIPLEMGSYRLRLRLEGYHEVLYPVHIQRQQHWHGRPPLVDEPLPIELPILGTLQPSDIYVPAGWFQVGGDRFANNAMPHLKLWCDGFVISKHPVSNRQYQEFLNHLLTQGEERLALRLSPKDGDSDQHETMYERNSQGQFVAPIDPESEVFGLDWPVCFVNHEGATLYADWVAQQTGVSWRLPLDYEWSKSARGVDGRYFPWGNHFDPSWCRMGKSVPADQTKPANISEYPVDVSPYGIRGMAGNMTDWTNTHWQEDGPNQQNFQVIPEHPTDDQDRVVRGGYWDDHLARVRLASRDDVPVEFRDNYLGFRLAVDFSSILLGNKKTT